MSQLPPKIDDNITAPILITKLYMSVINNLCPYAIN